MDVSRELIISEIKKAAFGKTELSKRDFHMLSGITEYQVLKYFDSWKDAIREAGLPPYTRNQRLSDDELFYNMLDIFEKLKGICTRTKFDRESKYSADTYKKRFGKWQNALVAFRKWLTSTGNSFSYMAQLPQSNEAPIKKNNLLGNRTKSWTPSGRTTFGSLLNFRGIQHAPVNEQGVVFLFGMVCLELGFIVESVRTGFPDCEAKRRVRGDNWERVRIEFEFKSRDFKQHGHDPLGCDMIVCWENNWAECPLEILELKNVIKELKAI